MKEVTMIGLDLAKSVFRVHGVDGSGKTVIRRQLRRGQVLPFFKKLRPCLMGMAACATSNYWAREIAALGHEVRMMPARLGELGVDLGDKGHIPRETRVFVRRVHSLYQLYAPA